MRLRYFIFLLPLLSAACSDPKPKSTVEEKVISQAFTGFVLAGVYDRVCNGDKLAKFDAKNPEHVNFMGNRQMFGARMGLLFKVRNPDAPLKMAVDALLDAEKSIARKAEESLKAKGCDSEAGQAAQKIYTLYTKSHPAQINEFIDKDIIKNGGTVTPPDAIDHLATPAEEPEEEAKEPAKAE